MYTIRNQVTGLCKTIHAENIQPVHPENRYIMSLDQRKMKSKIEKVKEPTRPQSIRAAKLVRPLGNSRIVTEHQQITSDEGIEVDKELSNMLDVFK